MTCQGAGSALAYSTVLNVMQCFEAAGDSKVTSPRPPALTSLDKLEYSQHAAGSTDERFSQHPGVEGENSRYMSVFDGKKESRFITDISIE